MPAKVYRAGEIYWAPFPKTGSGEEKERPILVISSDGYNRLTNHVLAIGFSTNPPPQAWTPIPFKVTEGALPPRRYTYLIAEFLFSIAENRLRFAGARVDSDTVQRARERIGPYLGQRERA